MKLSLTYFLLFFVINADAQSKKLKSEISKFVLSKYKLSKVYNHSIDTITKLPDGTYFVFVRNEASGANSVSGTYDQFQIDASKQFKILNSIKNIGDDTGGFGSCETKYKLYYLDSANYITVTLKTITHMGSFVNMTIVLNANKIYFDATVLEDYTGILDLSYENTISSKEKNNILESLLFKCQKLISDEESGKHKIFDKVYQIEKSAFNFELNRIMNIQLVSIKESIIELDKY